MKFVLAISGGRDSMALLRWMTERYPATDLIVAHFNHRQRGKASEGDARFVSREAKRLGIPCWVGRGEGGQKSEAALRTERWKFLRTIQAEAEADWVVTAHTLEDQLETFLMRLLRGVGLDGLAVMKKKERGIWRPFLSTPREKLPHVAYREDASNASNLYFRNRVRHQLLPVMFDLAHGGKRPFLRRFEALRKELEWARKIIRREEKKRIAALLIETPFWIRLPRASWIALSPAWQRRALRVIAKKLGVTDLTLAETRRIQKSLQSAQRRGDLGRGVRFEESCGQFFFLKEAVKATLEILPGDKSYRVRSPELGWEAEVAGKPAGEWRFFRDGDRLGSRKLKKLLLTQRVPAPERHLLPVWTTTSDSRVKWFYPQENPSVRILRADFPFSS